MPICKKCQNIFPNKIEIDNKVRVLSSRQFCLNCSPFGKHNTVDITKERNIVENEKVCSCCNKLKSIDEFFTRSNGKFYSYCRACTNILTIKRQHKNKLEAITYKGGKCSICGYNKCQSALEFHHTNPNEKDFSISSKKGNELKNIKKELDKCILVCRNCHAEIHYDKLFT